MSTVQSAPRAVIVGAGGHARVVAALLRENGTYDVAGVLDRTYGSTGETILGLAVTGSWDEIPGLKAHGIDTAFIALGDGSQRESLLERCRAAGLCLPPLVHPRAFVDSSATLGAATVVCALAHVGPDARVGRGVIVNTHASVDHESVVGDFATISPAVTIAGRCNIGARTFLGLGCRVSHGLEIGDGARVGAGAVVLRDVGPGAFAVGIPAELKGGRLGVRS